jgi:hypothetical protein
MARGVALVLSVGLGLGVIVNAQFGCDSPASNAPPPKDSTPVEPAKASEPQVEPRVEPQPQAAPAPNPAAQAEPAPAAKAKAAPEPVYMPASKSGGDFGAMQFPGEQAATPQQANPAPNK